LPDVGGRVGSLLFRAGLSPRALLPTPGTSCISPALTDAVCCLRREESGSAIPPFRVSMSRGCKVRFMLGPRLCFPPRHHTAPVGLSTPRLDVEISPAARGLLHGAPALTVAGLPPASPTQRGDLPAIECQWFETSPSGHSVVGLRRGDRYAVPFPEAPFQTVLVDFPHTAYQWSSHATCAPPG